MNILLAEFILSNAIGILVQCVICMTIIDALSGIKWDRRTAIVKVNWLLINFLFWFYVVKMGSFWNIAGILLDVTGYCIYTMVLKHRRISDIFAMVTTAQIANQVGALLVTFIIFVLDHMIKDEAYYVHLLLVGYMLRGVLLIALYFLEKRYQLSKILEKKRAKFIIIITGVVLLLTGLIMRINHENADYAFLYITFTILITGALFGVLWVIDWYFNEREKKLLWEDNHRMSQRLHRSREIMPALNSVLCQMKEDTESEKFQNILEEIHQLCKEQMGEDERADMQEKEFPSTGICILDEQIQLYGKEAAEKGIHFDMFAGIPMAEVLKEHQIKELDFLRLIGDLMRNAFRAIERSGREDGNILFIMGCVDQTVQIEIYDNGAPFPLFVLDSFGKRGMTQGGTGNGISDILETLERYQATFCLTEYEENATYSKGISIMWDKENGRWIESVRSSRVAKESTLLPKKF
ncbi:MAG: hypothetical protein HFI37_05205 [Lachnospiraceae bacterium]|nr:hypothetical protein [Lachnospiraceae bacterium]